MWGKMLERLCEYGDSLKKRKQWFAHMVFEELMAIIHDVYYHWERNQVLVKNPKPKDELERQCFKVPGLEVYELDGVRRYRIGDIDLYTPADVIDYLIAYNAEKEKYYKRLKGQFDRLSEEHRILIKEMEAKHGSSGTC